LKSKHYNIFTFCKLICVLDQDELFSFSVKRVLRRTLSITALSVMLRVANKPMIVSVVAPLFNSQSDKTGQNFASCIFIILSKQNQNMVCSVNV